MSGIGVLALYRAGRPASALRSASTAAEKPGFGYCVASSPPCGLYFDWAVYNLWWGRVYIDPVLVCPALRCRLAEACGPCAERHIGHFPYSFHIKRYDCILYNAEISQVLGRKATDHCQFPAPPL